MSLEMTNWTTLERYQTPTGDTSIDMTSLNGSHVLTKADWFNSNCIWTKQFLVEATVDSVSYDCRFALRIHDGYTAEFPIYPLEPGNSEMPVGQFTPLHRYVLVDVFWQLFQYWEGINYPDQFFRPTGDEVAFDFWAYEEITDLTKYCTSHTAMSLTNIGFKVIEVPGVGSPYVDYTPPTTPTFTITSI